MNSLAHYPEVNQLLQTLLNDAQTILNEKSVGMYLFGSLTSGYFDQDSDKEPARIKQRGGQSYTVLSICRILYTLRYGTVVSKQEAAHWAEEALGEKPQHKYPRPPNAQPGVFHREKQGFSRNRWTPLIEQTWEGRSNPGADASPDQVNETLDFIRYALEYSKELETLSQV